MSTYHYKIVWPTGKVSVDSSEAPTVAAYVQQRWGFNTEGEVLQHNVNITALGTDLQVAQFEAKVAAVAEAKRAAKG